METSELVNYALEARKKARTFRSSVGIAFEMVDGKVFDGFNVEPYNLKGYHAEEVGLIKCLDAGYNGTDFKRMVEVFQDAGHNEVEIFPACPSCWGYLWDFTHPNLEIIVADTEGRVHYSAKLKEIMNLPQPGSIFPSEKTRKAKPRSNSEPKIKI